jgi:hypothetical protein
MARVIVVPGLAVHTYAELPVQHLPNNGYDARLLRRQLGLGRTRRTRRRPSAVVADVADAAPRARIVVTGYPYLFAPPAANDPKRQSSEKFAAQRLSSIPPSSKLSPSRMTPTSTFATLT